MLHERLNRIYSPVVSQKDLDSSGIPVEQSRLESDRKRLEEGENKLQEAKNKLYENNEGGGRYGVDKDLWEQLTPEQRHGFAGMYAMIDPMSALSEGYREILETNGDLSLLTPDSTTEK